MLQAPTPGFDGRLRLSWSSSVKQNLELIFPLLVNGNNFFIKLDGSDPNLSSSYNFREDIQNVLSGYFTQMQLIFNIRDRAWDSRKLRYAFTFASSPHCRVSAVLFKICGHYS